jgi:hypothetical protein
MQAGFFAIPRRHGSIYMAVLAAAAVTTILGAGALAVARIGVRMTSATKDLSQARLNAESGIEIGRLLIAQDADWRANRASGRWVDNQAMPDGAFSLDVVDPNDGDLSDSSSDSVVMTATGVKGQARQKLRVTLVPQIEPLECLGAALWAGGNVSLTNGSSAMTFYCDQTLGGNAAVTASGVQVYSRVEAAGTVGGSTYQGQTASSVDARAMPDVNKFNQWYKSNGTAIDGNDLPPSGTGFVLSNVVLAPGRNPYGSGQTNAEGVYVINCRNKSLTIENCRIVGTLLVRNVTTCTVGGSVNWEPSVPNYPALMVEGNLALAFGNAALDEAALGVNFNPSTAPHQGASDADQSDSYASTLTGLAYATGDVSASGSPTINGQVIAGGTFASSGAVVTLSYRRSSYTTPPPGFRVAPALMKPDASSWAKVVD